MLESVSCSVLSNSFETSMDCSSPGSSVHGILQARILEWVTISFSKGSSQPRDQTLVPCIAGRFFTVWATREATTNFQKEWMVFSLYLNSIFLVSQLILLTTVCLYYNILLDFLWPTSLFILLSLIWSLLSLSTSNCYLTLKFSSGPILTLPCSLSSSTPPLASASACLRGISKSASLLISY